MTLAAAVAIDAVVVRLVLLPVVVRLGGHGIWRRPGQLSHVVPDIHFSH